MTEKERASCINTIELLKRLAFNVHGVMDVIDAENCEKIIAMLKQPDQKWIPLTSRPLTDEEKEEHPDWDSILDCKLPDPCQTILVSISCPWREAVQEDIYYEDDGSYLDSGYEIGTEATAWMPMPEAYKGEK